MMHSKSAYSLREIEAKDLDLVFVWRNSERIRKASYNDSPISREEHETWFQKLRNSADRICLIFEFNARPVGVVQFFDISSSHRKCKWGFYLGEEKLPKGVGTVMGEMALTYAFERLPVDLICGEALSHNEGSLRYHEKLGFVREGVIEKHFHRDGELRDIILFALPRGLWARLEGREASA